MPNPFPDEAFEALAEKYADKDFNLMRALLRSVLDVPVFNLPQGDKYLYANAIVTKIYRQACTVKYLLSGTRLWPDQVGERVLDTHSLEVIVRSILDSYLVFHH